MLAQVFLPPLISAALVVHFAPLSLRRYSSIVYLLAVPACWTIRIKVERLENKRHAKRLGAVLVPEVKGKWPGNVDLIFA